jgi:transcriptional regulator with XRE-family HTH domain
MTRLAGTYAIDQAIGARLRAYRRGKGMSQAELGAVLGVTFQQVQKYENGRNRLSGSRLVQVCGALDCTPAKLLGTNGGGAAAPSSFELLHDVQVHKLVLALGKQPPLRRKALAEALTAVVTALTLGSK